MNGALRRRAASAAASTAACVHRGGYAPGIATPTALAVRGAQVATSAMTL